MNIRILAASALALAILVPAANAATPSREVKSVASNGSAANCAGDNLNLATTECVPFHAKVVHAKNEPRVVKTSAAKIVRKTGVMIPNPDGGTENHPSQRSSAL